MEAPSSPPLPTPPQRSQTRTREATTAAGIAGIAGTPPLNEACGNECFVSLIDKIEEKVEKLSGRRGPPPGHVDVFHDMAVRNVAQERAQMTEALQAIHTKLAAAVSVSRAPSPAPSPALPRGEEGADGGLVGEGAEWLGEGGGKGEWEQEEERETPNPRTGQGDGEGGGVKDPMTVVLVTAEVYTDQLVSSSLVHWTYDSGVGHGRDLVPPFPNVFSVGTLYI